MLSHFVYIWDNLFEGIERPSWSNIRLPWDKCLGLRRALPILSEDRPGETNKYRRNRRCWRTRFGHWIVPQLTPPPPSSVSSKGFLGSATTTRSSSWAILTTRNSGFVPVPRSKSQDPLCQGWSGSLEWHSRAYRTCSREGSGPWQQWDFGPLSRLSLGRAWTSSEPD